MAKHGKDKAGGSNHHDVVATNNAPHRNNNSSSSSSSTSNGTSEQESGTEKSAQPATSTSNQSRPSHAKQQPEIVAQDCIALTPSSPSSSPLSLSKPSSSAVAVSTSTVAAATTTATTTTTTTSTTAVGDDKSRSKCEPKSIHSKTSTASTTPNNNKNIAATTTDTVTQALGDPGEDSAKVVATKDKKDKVVKDIDGDKTMNISTISSPSAHSNRALPPPPLPAKRTTSTNGTTVLSPPPPAANPSATIDFELGPIGRTRTLPNYGQQAATSFVAQQQQLRHQQHQHHYRHQKSCPQFVYEPKCPLEEANANRWWRFSNWSLVVFALMLLTSVVLTGWTTWTMVANARREVDSAKAFGDIVAIQAELSDLTLAVGWEMLSSINATVIDLSGRLDTMPSAGPSLSVSVVRRSVEADQPTLANVSSISEANSKSTSNTSSSSEQPHEMLARQRRTNLSLEQALASMARCSGASLASHGDSLTKAVNDVRELCSFAALQTSIASLNVSRLVNENNGRAQLFAPLTNCIRRFEKAFGRLDTLILRNNSQIESIGPGVGSNAKMEPNDMVVRAMPYTLFVRGLVARFTSLTLGLVALRSDFSHNVINASDYLRPFYVSRQLIESSFVWNSRHQEQHNEADFDHRISLLTKYLSDRDYLEQENYVQMANIFGQLFSDASLARIGTYIKKKNVESVERIMVLNNGTGTKYVADQGANNHVNLQLNIDEIEAIGLNKMKQIIRLNQGYHLSNVNISQQYNQVMKNQIAFVVRLHDYMNISVHKQSLSLLASTQQMWHSYGMLYAQLGQTIVSIFALLVCIYHFFVSRYRGGRDTVAPAASSISQRVRRRFWNVTSTWALLKSCFSFSSSGSSATNAAPSSSSLNVISVVSTGGGNVGITLGSVGTNGTGSGPTRSYPLHYKANDNFGSPGNNRRGASIRACTCGQQAQQQQQSQSQPGNQQQLTTGSSRRGYRYAPLPTTPPSASASNGNGSASRGANYSPHITKTAMLTYRYEASKAAAAAAAAAANGGDN